MTTPRRGDGTVLCAGADPSRDRLLGLRSVSGGYLHWLKSMFGQELHSFLALLPRQDVGSRQPVVQAWDSEPMRSGEGAEM